MAHVAGAQDGPFIVLLQQPRADEACDGGLVGEDPHDLAAPLDLVVQAFEQVDEGRGTAAAALKRSKSQHVPMHQRLRATLCSPQLHRKSLP